ncbi:MAG TPA: ATP synthase F1 subunit epsilon [Candidatus Nitrosopolaris sp.]|nr:ATP synthase F1 subunit epsilon [Candidatus Nitrosopolaris sp.]
MRFQLVASSGLKFDDEAYEVMVPTKAGVISIFEDHMPLISSAQPGVLSIRKKAGDNDSSLEHFAINGGMVEVDGKTVSFVADDVTTADEISEKDAEAALAFAEDLVKNADTQSALHEAHRTLQHSSAQLHIARLKRRHHQ